MFRSNNCWLSYGPWTCIFCPKFKLSGLVFDVLWDIDLIFGMWLYLDELQFKFEFRFGRMIFGWVMSFELVFFVQILSCPDFLFYVLWDIDLIFGMWLYLDELHFKFKLWPLNLYVLFKLLVFRTFYWRPMRYWFDIWYIAISTFNSTTNGSHKNM